MWVKKMENDIVIHKSLIRKNSECYRILIPYTDISEDYLPYTDVPGSLINKTDDGNYTLNIHKEATPSFTAYSVSPVTATRHQFKIAVSELPPLFDTKLRRLAFSDVFVPGADVMELMNAADMLGLYLESSNDEKIVFTNETRKVHINFDAEKGIGNIKIGKISYTKDHFRDNLSDTDIYVLPSGRIITSDMMADRILTVAGIGTEIHDPSFIKSLGPTLPAADSPVWETVRINKAINIQRMERIKYDIVPADEKQPSAREGDLLLIRDRKDSIPSVWKIEEYKDGSRPEDITVRLLEEGEKYDPVKISDMYRTGKPVITGYIHKGKRVQTKGFDRIYYDKSPKEQKDIETQEDKGARKATKILKSMQIEESLSLPLEERINLARSLTGRGPRTGR